MDLRQLPELDERPQFKLDILSYPSEAQTMPEIAEVARAVHFIRKYLVGKTFEKVTAINDNCVFEKVGTNHTEIMKHLTGKKVVDAGQQGKYFWMIMSSPPHPVMHFGMSGWLKFKSEHSFYYTKKHDKEEAWPPGFWKILFETDGKGDEKIEAAYCDSRRFGRVRLVDCPGEDIRQYTPLVENGPDPVQDKDLVTFEWLKALCNRKKVPIKAMLLDQANISGIGNWVGDEIMFDAKMHPEQYAHTLSDADIRKLHKSIHYVCGTAVDLLADSEQFPKTWLFKHRWGKGKKDGTKALPTGEKIVFLTVGGRTSAVVPSIQKKTGPVAKELSDAEEENEVIEEKPAKSEVKKGAKTKKSAPEIGDDTPKKTKGTKRVKAEEDDKAEISPPKKKARKSTTTKVEQKQGNAATPSKVTPRGGESNDNADVELKNKTPVNKKKATAKTPPSSKSEGPAGRRRSSRING